MSHRFWVCIAAPAWRRGDTSLHQSSTGNAIAIAMASPVDLVP